MPNQHFANKFSIYCFAIIFLSIDNKIAKKPTIAYFDGVGNGDIWTVNIDTGVQTQLTDTPQMESYPDWSPVGGQIKTELRFHAIKLPEIKMAPEKFAY